MEHAKNVHVFVFSHEVGDSVMSVEQNPHMPFRGQVSISNLRVISQHLSALVDAKYNLLCGVRTRLSDILKDVFKPPRRFLGPDYFCHERIRRSISALEMVRRLSESANPRCTIR